MWKEALNLHYFPKSLIFSLLSINSYQNDYSRNGNVETFCCLKISICESFHQLQTFVPFLSEPKYKAIVVSTTVEIDNHQTNEIKRDIWSESKGSTNRCSIVIRSKKNSRLQQNMFTRDPIGARPYLITD